MTQAKQFTCPCCGNQSDHLDYEEQTTTWQYFGDTGDFIDENEYEWDKIRQFFHCPQCFEVVATSEDQAKQLFKPKAKTKKT